LAEGQRLWPDDPVTAADSLRDRKPALLRALARAALLVEQTAATVGLAATDVSEPPAMLAATPAFAAAMLRLQIFWGT